MLIWHYAGAGADHNIDANIMLMLASEFRTGWITCDADYADGSQVWVMLMLISIFCWCWLKKKLRDGPGKSEWSPAHLFRGWLCKVTLIIFQTYVSVFVFANMFCICIYVLFLSFWAKLNWHAFRVWQLSTRGPLAEHWFSRPVSLLWSIYDLSAPHLTLADPHLTRLKTAFLVEPSFLILAAPLLPSAAMTAIKYRWLWGRAHIGSWKS